MKYTWSLENLYKSFEDAKFLEDYNSLPKQIKEFSKWAESVSADLNKEKIEEFLKKDIDLSKTFEKIGAFAQLSYTVNVNDEKAIKTIEFCEKLSVDFKEIFVIFSQGLKNISNLNEIINSSDFLKEHEFFLKEIKDSLKYQLSKEEEIAIAKIKNTGSKAWSKLQENLTATLNIQVKVEGEEKTLPLPAVRNLAYEANPETRKNAYEAELKAYERVDSSVASALNAIKGEALTESEMRGYISILEKTLIDSRIKKETLDAMLSAIVDSLPDFAKFLRKKAEVLGHSNGLPFFDLFAPVGEANLTFTEEEAKEFILKNFYSFSQNLGDMAKKAFEENWIDFNPREGKVGGAFCYNLQSIGESRILSNFTGSFSDVGTLAHELGHAYHGYALNDESYLNTNYSMPIAETASIFCETIVKNAILKTASDKEKFFILEQDISDSLQVIVDIYSRYVFESSVIEKRKEGSLSVEEFKNLMIQAQKEAYRDGLDHEFLHPYMWLCKGHYYEASLNFYNFPYAFGLLFAKGLYAQYLEKGEAFVEKYDKLLALTGKASIEDVVAYMDIDISSREFWDASLNLIKKDIKKFIELAK